MILKNSSKIGSALLPLKSACHIVKSKSAVRHAQPSLRLSSVAPGLRGEDPHLFSGVIRSTLNHHLVPPSSPSRQFTTSLCRRSNCSRLFTLIHDRSRYFLWGGGGTL